MGLIGGFGSNSSAKDKRSFALGRWSFFRAGKDARARSCSSSYSHGLRVQSRRSTGMHRNLGTGNQFFFFSLSLLSRAPADAISVVSYTRRARARGIVGEEGFRMNMLVVPGKTATDPGGPRHTFRAKAKTAVYGGGNAVPAVLFFSFFGRRRRPSRLQPCACPQPDASTRWR